MIGGGVLFVIYINKLIRGELLYKVFFRYIEFGSFFRFGLAVIVECRCGIFYY